MNVLSQTLSGWFTPDERIRTRLHAAARNVIENASWLRGFSRLSVPMSATRPVEDLTAARRETSPGESPAPTIAFPTAAGWVPALPPELRQPPPVRLTASGVYRVVHDQRQTGTGRRFNERRVRDDGSPYGVERRQGAEDRAGDRRTTADPIPASHRPSARRVAVTPGADYVPHLPDLLARFHGR
jgi:hypothetical protein